MRIDVIVNTTAEDYEPNLQLMVDHRMKSIPVLDSAAIGVWAALRTLAIDRTPVSKLGRLFA